MKKCKKTVIDVLQGRVPSRTPIWLMRQAGRYLPEYREIRLKSENFVNTCLNSDLAAEITLQPVKRFGVDAAILFADILLVPLALGVSVEFKEGDGPVVGTIGNEGEIEELLYDEGRVAGVFETVGKVSRMIGDDVTLIGFCGAPWTVACYMLDGGSRGGFGVARGLVDSGGELVSRLIGKIVDASECYLGSQIEAGAEVIQIFDSWAGLLLGYDFERFVIEPTRDLVSRLKKRYPNVPVIGFPRGARENYERYARQAGVDALGLDQSVDLEYAQRELQPILPLQGNLDPEVLLRGGEELRHGVRRIMDVFGRGHIVNLGHGVVPKTPVENVADMVRFVREYGV